MRKRDFVAALACGMLALVAWLALGGERRDGSRAAGSKGLVSSESETRDGLGVPDPDVGENAAARQRAIADDFVAPVAPGDEAPPSDPKVIGRVVDGFGDAIEGAEVFFASADQWVYADLDVALGPRDSRIRYRRTVLTTDRSGRFQLRDFERGRLRYLVRAAGFAPSGDDNVRPPTSGVLDLGNIGLEPALIIEGRVVDPDGHGIADAELARATTPDDFGFRTHYAPVARTNDDGAFRIDTLAPGEWEIRVDSDKHPIARFAGMTFEPGVSRGHVFTLERAWTISGWLTAPELADCSNLIVSAKPVTKLEADDPLQWERTVATVDCEVDGRFAFRRLFAPDASTVYALSVWQKNVANLSNQVGATVEALVGSADVRIPIDAPATLRFELRSGGEPLADPIVYVGWYDVTARGQLRSLAAGRFEVVGIQTKPQRASDQLRIQVAGFREYVRFDLPLVEGGELDLGVLKLEPAIELDLVVVDRETGVPVEAVSITRYSPDVSLPKDVDAKPGIVHTDGRFGNATTDADGRARISLAEGYANALMLEHAGYAPKRIEVESDEVARRVELSSGATVRVRTEDETGTPVPDMRVTGITAWTDIEDPLMTRSLLPRSQEQTDADGIALFERLPSGPTTFSVRARFFASGERSIDVGEGDDIELVFVVAARADLEVLVRESGLPLVDAEVRLCAVDELDDQGQVVPAWQRWTIASARTNGRGIARLEHAPVGEYDLAISHATRSLDEARRVIVAVDGERVVVDLSVPTVEGVVRSIDGSACAGAYVYGIESALGFSEIASDAMLTRNSNTSYPGVVRTNAGGHFLLRGLITNTSLVVVAVPEDGVGVVSDPFTLSADEKMTVELPRAIRAGSLDVTVEPKGRVLEEVEFEYLGPRDDVFREFQVWTNRRIDPHFDSLAPGNWRARAVQSGGIGSEPIRGPWAAFEVVEETTTTLVLTLPK